LLLEFEKIFDDLFGKQKDQYAEIVQTVIDHPKTYDQITAVLGIAPSGALSQKLHTLVQCGFLSRDYVWQGTKQSKKHSKFRLSDNYLRFYLKYIEPVKPLITQGVYRELDLENLPNWQAMMGLQFENMVLNNLPLILRKLQVSSETLLSAAPYFQNSTKRKEGCQIDLLIQTKYTVFVCEIKFKQKIGKSVVEEVLEKIQKLTIPKTVTIRPVLIYVGELSSQVEAQNFFSHLLAFEDLLYSSKSAS